MITYFVARSANHTICDYLASAGQSLAHLVDVLPYDDLYRRLEIAAGCCIFAALDQVSDVQRHVIRELAGQLGGSHVRVLNDPRHVRLRCELLRTLYAAGENVFNAYRATEASEVARFPVFVRDEHLHNGSLTPLVHTVEELQAALRALMLRGRRLSDLLIVEFCDTADERGLFRKYAAFKVGDTIIPRYLQVSPYWMIKEGTRISDRDALAEDREYLESNPHEAWLRDIFALARIDYGRIDYGMLKGRPQVWEINTNPALGCSLPIAHHRHRSADAGELDALKAIFHERFADALTKVAGKGDNDPLPLRLDDEIRGSLRIDAHHARRHDRLASWVTRVVESPWVQTAKPWLKRIALSLAPIIARIPRRP